MACEQKHLCAMQALSITATSRNWAGIMPCAVARLLEVLSPVKSVQRSAGKTPLICAGTQGHTAIVYSC